MEIGEEMGRFIIISNAIAVTTVNTIREVAAYLQAGFHVVDKWGNYDGVLDQFVEAGHLEAA